MTTKLGRPSIYTEELAQEICKKLSLGASLRKICEEEGAPDLATVLRWVISRPDFCEQYRKAQEAKGEVLFSELLDMAEADCDPRDVPHLKLKIDTRKWAISKMFPKKYGDKVETVHSGEVKLEKITRTVVDP